ncbi:hypothetical protein DENSPDRAFT_855654, partial [Dentipellis sp. KUC8613]
VPAATYGGPNVPLDEPSDESIKLAESLVLLEFVAELYPDSNLSPKDAVDRAHARFFISATNELTTSLYGFVLRGAAPDALVKDFKMLQRLLPPSGGFAVGDFSFADAAVAPFLVRAELYLRNDIGKFNEGEGIRLYKQVFESAQFAWLQQYWKDIVARPSIKATFNEVSSLQFLRDMRVVWNMPGHTSPGPRKSNEVRSMPNSVNGAEVEEGHL